jgi:hypothetical protein
VIGFALTAKAAHTQVIGAIYILTEREAENSLEKENMAIKGHSSVQLSWPDAVFVYDFS